VVVGNGHPSRDEQSTLAPMATRRSGHAFAAMEISSSLQLERIRQHDDAQARVAEMGGDLMGLLEPAVTTTTACAAPRR
jgi:hypothetical protein